ncbi:MAG: alpha-amylase [Burkholderiaceae bacterium]|nr:alpha-amylase [Roseateles sp.]MBV8470849.1 alpha-amylase [Burkholderiaceae bacterium]
MYFNYLLAASLLGLSLSSPAADTSHDHSDARRPPPHWSEGVFMEIFVRGYQDSTGDGIGDLRGLISRLDYLQQLGVTGLWLMPVTQSADHDHGYAVAGFRSVERDYGTLADVDELLRQAHRRGMGVVFDYILNHSAAEHPIFQAAAADPASPTRDWYVWRDGNPPDLQDWDIWGYNPWYALNGSHYFATFGAGVPDFNLRNPAVINYHRDNLRFWLDRGLDGFRLDAVPHLIENSAKDWNDQPESRRLTGEFTALIRGYPGRHVVCEATASPQAYAKPDVCGSAFAFGLERQIVQAARNDAAAVAAVSHYFETAPASMATMLANHDIFAGQRLWDQFKGDEAAYKLAAATLLLLPGTPFLYYGEEIGMAGLSEFPDDRQIRAPMSWTAAGGFSASAAPFRPVSPNAATHNVELEAGDPDSLLNFYRSLVHLRTSQAALMRGAYRQAFAQGSVLGFQRELGHERLLVLINYAPDPWQGAVPGLAAGQRLQALWQTRAQAKPVSNAANEIAPAASVTLPPQSVAVYRLH